MPLVDVGPLEDFAPNEIRVVEVNGREIGIARWQGEVYALRNVCPHQAGPVCSGRLLAGIGSKTVGSLEAQLESPVVACAWHGWEFQLTTGQSLWDPNFRIRTYDVQVRDGRLLVDLGGRRVA